MGENDNNFKLKFEDGHQIIKPKYSILRQLGIKNIIKPPRQHILLDLIFNIEKIEALSSIKVLQFINQLSMKKNILATFYFVHNFCKFYDKFQEQNRISNGHSRPTRKCSMHLSVLLTSMIHVSYF